MNYALIFAGGTGSRMNSDIPKQFLEVNKKPVLIHTIEKFEKNECIDKILIVCLKDYIDVVFKFVEQFGLNKVLDVISGGKTAFESQRIGIDFLHSLLTKEDDIVFVHDGVRPMIDELTINKCLETAKNSGSAVTISPASETIGVLNADGQITKTISRENCMLARAPQVFFLKDLYNAHQIAGKNNKEYIDSASMFLDQGKNLSVVEGPSENIKITTQYDFALFKMLQNN